ncbi:MAG TPA: cupredoxin domain-containing protein [Sphingomicrobium sp.]|jgi:plastocyanin|nr:cupredoxin domain-containing protein [Sphingomicrobium sp.]
MIALFRASVRNALAFVLLAFVAFVPVAAAAPAGHEYVVSMANMAFGRMPSGLKVGDSIVFINKDSVPHTVTARDHSFDLRIGPGQRGRLNLTKAGTYQIYCILHAPMRGTLTVGS